MQLNMIKSCKLARTLFMAAFIVFAALPSAAAGRRGSDVVLTHGAVTRMNPAVKSVALVFTAASTCDGADTIASVLKKCRVRGHFFFTGEFFERYPQIVKRLLHDGHYIGCHGYSHMLYSPWNKPDSMLVTRGEFIADMDKAYGVMKKFGISKRKAYYFIAPYEHYNDTVAEWARQYGLTLVNNTYGTLTYGDYTTPDMKHYYSSEFIMNRLMRMAAEKPQGINGHILLIHLGTSEKRPDKFYWRLEQLIGGLRALGYSFADLSKVVPRP